MTAAPWSYFGIGLARGLVGALGGSTQKDIADIVRGLAVAGPPHDGTKGRLRRFQQRLPSDAVVAFDLPPPHPCPLGWTVFKEATYRHRRGRTPRRVQIRRQCFRNRFM